jgi:hypothetical protein
MDRERSILKSISALSRAECDLDAAEPDISLAVKRLLARNYAIGMSGAEGMPARIRNFEMVAASVDPGSDRNSRFALDILEAVGSIEQNGVSPEALAEAFRLSDRTNIYSRHASDLSAVESDALVVSSLLEETDVSPPEFSALLTMHHASRRRSRMARLALPSVLGTYLGMRHPVYDRHLVTHRDEIDPSSAEGAGAPFLDRIGAYAERVSGCISRLKQLRSSAERRFQSERTDSRAVDVFSATFRHPVATPRIIAAACGMSSRGASMTLDKLEKEDLVTRTAETTLARKIFISEKILVDH